LLTRTTFLERFTEIPKNLLANQDAYVWINMLFHIGQKIRDKSVAKISMMNLVNTVMQVLNLSTLYSWIITGKFKRLN
jgi:hypothetical protein